MTKEPTLTISPEGAMIWRVGDKIHREDGPAIIYPSGQVRWVRNGLNHREDDLPALITEDGEMSGHVDNAQHRGDGMPYLIASQPAFAWKKHGKSHREGGLPAVVSPIMLQWMVDGKTTREGGLPASISSTGISYRLDSKIHNQDASKPAGVAHTGMVWAQHGLDHREGNLPARIMFDKDLLSWKIKGLRHRVGGACQVKKHERPIYYMFGQQYDEDTYWQLIDQLGGLEIALALPHSYLLKLYLERDTSELKPAGNTGVFNKDWVRNVF